MVVDRGRPVLVVNRQDLMEQLGGHAIGGQRRPFRLQIQQFGTAALRQQAGEGPKGMVGVGMAVTLLPAGIAHLDPPEERTKGGQGALFEGAVLPARRARPLPGAISVHLRADHPLLHLPQQVLALCQRQPEGGQGGFATGQLRDFLRGFGAVVGGGDELEAEVPGNSLISVRNAALTARRWKGVGAAAMRACIRSRAAMNSSSS